MLKYYKALKLITAIPAYPLTMSLKTLGSLGVMEQTNRRKQIICLY